MKKVIIVLLIALLVVVGYKYNIASSVLVYDEPITVDTINIYPSDMQAEIFVIGEYFCLNQTKTTENFQAIQTNSQSISVTALSDYTATVKLNGKTVYQGDDLNSIIFESIGAYNVTVNSTKTTKEYTANYSYDFVVEVVENPILKISNSSPVQGELVTVTIEGLFNQYLAEIACDFSPSANIYGNGTLTFYLPITYYKAAKEYPLNINIDGENHYEFNEILSVQPYEFSTIHFTVDDDVTESTVNSAAANQEYRNKIHPLYNTVDLNKYWSGKFIKPVEETRISSTFGQMRYINNSTYPERHSGIDYAAPEGTPVYAPADGKIEFSDLLMLSGNTIVLEHGLGLKSYFFHMDSLNVNAGDIVKQGDLIGTVGTTGYSTGPHLHYQVSIQNQPVNPELLY